MLITLCLAFVAAGPASGPIASATDPNWCIGHADPANRNQVAVQACAGAQRWSRHGYELRIEGMCLHRAESRTEEGAPLLLAPCNGGPSQRWVLRNQQLVQLGGAQCVAAREDARGNGGLLVSSACSDEPAQQWRWPPAWDAKPAAVKDKGWLVSGGKVPTSFVTAVQYNQREFVSQKDSLARCREFCWKNPDCAGFFEQTHLCPEPAANDGLTNPNNQPAQGCYRICGFYDRGDNPLWGRAVAGPAGSVWIKAETFRADGVQTPQSFFDGPFSLATGPESARIRAFSHALRKVLRSAAVKARCHWASAAERQQEGTSPCRKSSGLSTCCWPPWPAPRPPHPSTPTT